VRVVEHLPAEHAAPEARQTKRVAGFKANRHELTSHALRTFGLPTLNRGTDTSSRTQSER
jgi:hypothetical protein